LRELLVGSALLAVASFALLSSADASMCGLHDMRCGYGPHGGTNRDPVYNAVCPHGRRMCPPGQCALSGRRDACDMRNWQLRTAHIDAASRCMTRRGRVALLVLQLERVPCVSAAVARTQQSRRGMETDGFIPQQMILDRGRVPRNGCEAPRPYPICAARRLDLGTRFQPQTCSD
jgi:hypothetical protein